MTTTTTTRKRSRCLASSAAAQPFTPPQRQMRLESTIVDAMAAAVEVLVSVERAAHARGAWRVTVCATGRVHGPRPVRLSGALLLFRARAAPGLTWHISQALSPRSV
jgi:hypothetical protein